MDLSQSLKTILKYSWLIALFAVVVGGLAYVVSGTLQEEYESETTVLVGSLTQPDLQELLGYQELARVYASLAESRLVLEGVVDATGTDRSVDDLTDRVSAATFPNEALVRIVVTAPHPEEAAQIASAVADEVVNLGKATPSSLSLGRIVEPATVETTPSSPRVLFNTAVAAALGAGLGLLIAFMLGARYDAPAKQPEPSDQQAQMGQPRGPYAR